MPGTLTIPGVPGVEYSVDGVLASAGTSDKAPGSYVVTAAAQTGYDLVGYLTGGWTLTIAPATCVVPVEFVSVTNVRAVVTSGSAASWAGGLLVGVGRGQRLPARVPGRYPAR